MKSKSKRKQVLDLMLNVQSVQGQTMKKKHEKKAEENMNNKYLEKIAQAKWKQKGIEAGTISPVTGKPNEEIRNSLRMQGPAKGTVEKGGTSTVKATAAQPAKSGFFGIGKKDAIPAVPAHNVNTNGISGDKLAEGPSLKQRLETHKAGNFRAAEKVSIGSNAGKVLPTVAKPVGTTGKGIINKAMEFAKKKPLLAGGIAAGAAVLGANALGKKQGRNEAYGQ